MIKWKDIQIGKFISREKRFFVNVLLNGEIIKAYCPNTGRMTGLLTKDSECLLTKIQSKLEYQWEAVKLKDQNLWIGVNTFNPNKIAIEAINHLVQTKQLEDFPIEKERKFGRFRVDFQLGNQLIEVKNVHWIPNETFSKIAFFPDCKNSSTFSDCKNSSTFSDCKNSSTFSDCKNSSTFSDCKNSSTFSDCKNSSTFSDCKKIAFFPDCKTERGARQLLDMKDLFLQGYKCYTLYIVQRNDAEKVSIAKDIDLNYYNNYKSFPIESFAFNCFISTEGLFLNKQIDFILD
jgi:DNA-binding sugar fermentation-stimulating protein